MTPDPAPKKDFFISYNKADKPWAEWIAWQLEEEKYSVIIQAWDFRPGLNFMGEMRWGLDQAARFLGILSPDYLSASYSLQELDAALAADPTGTQQFVLLVRVRPCDLPRMLRAIIRINLDGLPADQAKHELLQGLKTGRAKPDTAPVFPGTRLLTKQPLFPGHVPAIWNIPHLRNLNFTGRDDLLAALHDALSKNSASVLTQALHGLGGVGKTQTALEYACRYGFEYDLVWWLGAEESTRLAADYAALAAKLNLPEKDLPDQPAVIAAVKDWLRTHSNWLLIFDNAQEPGEMKHYLPVGSGHVLVSSRNPNWGSLAATQSVPLLPRDQAVAFLLKKTGQQDAAAADQAAAAAAEFSPLSPRGERVRVRGALNNTFHLAADLAEALGDLPLALEQAGAYIAASGISLPEYLELFHTRRQDLWGEETSPDNYDHTVAATWSLSLEKAEQEAPGAAALLNLCAFLAPDAIPRSLLEVEPDFLPPVLNRLAANSLARNRVFTALRRYSLLEVAHETLALHRLVQAVIRDRLDEENQKQWAEAAVHLVNAAFPFESLDVRTWEDCARLLPHALAAAGHAEALGIAMEAAGRLLNQAGLYLKGRAEYAEAEPLLRRALAIGRSSLGPDHPEVAIDLNNLALLLQATNRLAEAEPLMRRALAVMEKSLGPDHPNTVTVRQNLASLNP